MKIVVLDGYTLNPGDNSWQGIEQLGELIIYDRTDATQIVKRSLEADILVTNKTPLTAETLKQLDQLKFIAVTATGYNIVDVDAASDLAIPVSNVPVYGSDTVAQHVFALLLSFIHRPEEHDQAIRAGEWSKRGDFSFWMSPLTELANKTMGIVGFGRIGQRVAEIANAFGMKVLAYNPSEKPLPDVKPFEFVSLEVLFARADIVSLHCPQTSTNQGFVKGELLQKMKRSAILVNSARGGLINENDLADALNTGLLAGACLDVFSGEPIAVNNPLLEAKNCLLTPHYAWATLEARIRLMNSTAENIKAFLNDEPVNVVNIRQDR